MSFLCFAADAVTFEFVYIQVDADTVKSMDKNLFMGEEIKEVYHEIMKTIPTDHFELSNVSF